MRLFLGGDVMLGRSLDALMPHPSRPEKVEGSDSSPARHLARIERAYGKVSLSDPPSLWGDLLPQLERFQPDLSLVNLECAITTSDDIQAKRLSFRMHPQNLPFLQAIAPTFCSLANNHTMDWGIAGLRETWSVLKKGGIASAGAGNNLAEAQAPAVLQAPGGPRVLVFAITSLFAGSPASWCAGDTKPGQWLLPSFTSTAVQDVLRVISAHRRDRDVVIVSAHWGGNWSAGVDPGLREFCHGLIDGGVDLIHGHSSHHVKPLEVYKGRLILYGCGDLMDDYCFELSDNKRMTYRLKRYRPDLELAYFADLTSEGILEKLTLVPLRLRALRLQYARQDELAWLATALVNGDEEAAISNFVNNFDALTLRLP